MAFIDDIARNFVKIIRIIVDLISNFIFGLVYRGQEESVLPVTDDVLLQTATDLAGKIRKGEIKSTDVVKNYINRIREIQLVLNVVADDRFEDAIADATKVDELIESHKCSEEELSKTKPFLGVPFTTKEAISVKGLNFSSGLISRKGIKAEKDADVIDLMRKAGAIPVAVTNISELCMWWESNNNIYGRSKNPYNTTRIVGGSSGGEGAILAAAGSVIGVGSDVGGSIRIPSFFNGIFGHKPSSGIVSNDGAYPVPVGDINKLLVTGPMCRYATDLLPMMKVLAGKNISKLKLDSQVNIKDLKVYYMIDDTGNPFLTRVHRDIKNGLKNVVKHFQAEYGIETKQVNLQKLKHSFAIWSCYMRTHASVSFCAEMGGKKREINPFLELSKLLFGWSDHTLAAIGLGILEKFVSSEKNSNYLHMGQLLKEELEELLQDNCIFLYPTHPEPAPFHNAPHVKPFNVGYTAIFNALGFPVTHCPLGLSQDGIPYGIQVIAGMNNDHVTMAVAVDLEKKFGGWVNSTKCRK